MNIYQTTIDNSKRPPTDHYLHKYALGGKGTAVLLDQGVGGVVDLLVWEMADWPHLKSHARHT